MAQLLVKHSLPVLIIVPHLVNASPLPCSCMPEVAVAVNTINSVMCQAPENDKGVLTYEVTTTAPITPDHGFVNAVVAMTSQANVVDKSVIA